MAAMEILIPIIITALISRVTIGRTAATATAVIMAVAVLTETAVITAATATADASPEDA